MSDFKVFAMIPARYGSTRLKMKNLALINGKPMISYAVEAAKQSGVFDKVVINSESEIFKEIADKHNIEFYHRPTDLGSSEAKSDSVVADFMETYHDADIVVWVNPISPFQKSNEIAEVVKYFFDNKLDSLITVENKQVHCMYNNIPVNFELEDIFAQTQDLMPVQAFVYSLMMWRRAPFLSKFNEKGHALFCGKFGVYPVKNLTKIIVKTGEDLKLADLLMRMIENEGDDYSLTYDKLADLHL